MTGMNLAIIAGDGIGPEVIGEAVKVLDAVLPEVEKTTTPSTPCARTTSSVFSSRSGG